MSLREVVRYLGGSGGASGRLTRGRVQGLLEEEAARGRLERTRLGALALPRGDRPGRAPPAASARAARSKVSAPGRCGRSWRGRESREGAGRRVAGIRPRSPWTPNAVGLVSDLICGSLSFLGCKRGLLTVATPGGS